MTHYEQLRTLLEKLFLLDQADLDFGFYRVWRLQQAETRQLLEKDLLPAIESADAEVCAWIHRFFSRYYEEGGSPLRRRLYGKGPDTSLARNEVQLSWPERGQFFVYSREPFDNYAFRLPSGKRVHLRLVSPSEENGSKPPGRKRRYQLCRNRPVCEEDGELVLRFVDSASRKEDRREKNKQAVFNQETVATVFETSGIEAWLQELRQPPANKGERARTILEKHLTQFTEGRSPEYFIHPDLGRFLRQELEFFLSSEVLGFNQFEDSESEPNSHPVVQVEKLLKQINDIRGVTLNVIDVLEKVENVQKTLWLKKKFVVEIHYCVTLEHVPRELYPAVAANRDQREEWVRLFSIDQIESAESKPGYTEPLTLSFLESHTHLPLDTRHFDSEFTFKLLDAIDDLDAVMAGTLIHGDNFQALQLLQRRLTGRIDSVYIDPPFKTGRNFSYKDSYGDSAWLSLMQMRLLLLRPLVAESGSLFVHLDHKANFLGRQLLNEIFGKENFQNELVWHYRSGGRQVDAFSHKHDTIYLYQKTEQRRFYPEAVSEKRGTARRNNMKKQVDEDGRVFFSIKSAGKEYRYYEDEKVVPDDVWSDINHLQQKDPERSGFLTQKPEHLLRRLILCSTQEGDRVLDVFAGSGTTLATAHKLGRRWCGVEKGPHFDDILLPRMKRVLAGEKTGISRDGAVKSSGIFEYLRLESYDDSINNLPETTGQRVESGTAANETVKGHPPWSLISPEVFQRPDGFTLKIERQDRRERVTVDLVSTFNWLLGLRVRRIKKRGDIQVVEGTNPEGEHVLILWRDQNRIDDKALQDWLAGEDGLLNNSSIDVVYVNGTNNLESLGPADQTWRVKRIEEEFTRLMFADDFAEADGNRGYSR